MVVTLELQKKPVLRFDQKKTYFISGLAESQENRNIKPTNDERILKILTLFWNNPIKIWIQNLLDTSK